MLLRILLLEDNPADADLVLSVLQRGGISCEIERVEHRSEFEAALARGGFDVILADHALPAFDGMAALALALERWPETPFILVSGVMGEELAIEVMKAGATDYVLKQRLERLVPAVNRALREAKDRREHRRIEQELRESQQQFRLFVDSVRDYAIFALDVEGRISSWNQGAERIYGYGEEEIVGRHVSVLFTPEQVADSEPQRELGSALREGRYSSQGWRVRKDGSRFWADTVATALQDEEGGVRGIMKIVGDITERKRAEEERARLLADEREARRQAQAASRTKDEFLATVSHELRTPLTAMLGWAQMLRTGKLDAESTRRGLELIERNAKLQAQLVEELLDVSRIITGKLRLNLRMVDLVSIVRPAVDAFQPAAEAKGIVLAVGGLDPESSWLRADAERLQQVVWNLLSNAIKFTQKGGRIDVHLERAGSQMRVRVRDTGLGVDPAFLPFAFDRFRQADSSSTRPVGGLGLGLAIVRHLVELHGGSVHAHSEGIGKGSEFWIELPIAGLAEPPAAEMEAPTPTARAPLGSRNDLGGVRVLVVDDDKDTLEMLRIALEHYGARVTAVTSGTEAVDALRSARPHVLVSDIGLKGESGYAMIRRMRRLEGELGWELPALALTGYAREEDRQRALDSGFQAHVSKPIEPAALAGAVARLARSRKDHINESTPAS